MYIKNVDLNVIRDGCYILKSCLRCSNGIFSTGTEVKISLLRQGNLSNIYAVESADAYDYLHLNKEISAEEWTDKMLEEDAISTIRYETVTNDYETTQRKLWHKHNIEENFIMAIFYVSIAFCVFTMIMSRSDVWDFTIRLLMFAVEFILILVLLTVSRNSQIKELDDLRDSRNQEFNEILLSGEAALQKGK